MSEALEKLKNAEIVKYTKVDTALIQLFKWQHKNELPWLIKEQDRILQGKNRIVVLACRGAQYSLFVNKVTDII